MYKEQNCNTFIQLEDDEWEDSCTFTSIHTMFAFCSLIIGITLGSTSSEYGNDNSEKNKSQKVFENMKLCIVCEEEAKNAVSILLNALSLYISTERVSLRVQDVVYTHLKHLDSDSLYLHKLANDIIGDLEQNQHLHLLVLLPINKMMVPGIDKDVSSRLSYTALTGINNSMSCPPMTIPPCFTGVISTITVESTLDTSTLMSAKMEVQKYCHGSDNSYTLSKPAFWRECMSECPSRCICGHNIEYEDDVIHSHYETEEYSYDGNSSYHAAYFQNVGKPMPRCKFMNEVSNDCLGCRIVARVYTSKRPTAKRSHLESDDTLYHRIKYTKIL